MKLDPFYLTILTEAKKTQIYNLVLVKIYKNKTLHFIDDDQQD